MVIAMSTSRIRPMDGKIIMTTFIVGFIVMISMNISNEGSLREHDLFHQTSSASTSLPTTLPPTLPIPQQRHHQLQTTSSNSKNTNEIITTNTTNSTFISNFTMANNTINTTIITTSNYTFCQAPHYSSVNERYQNTCKTNDETWKRLQNDNSTVTEMNTEHTDNDPPSKNLTEIRSLVTLHSKRQRQQQQEQTEWTNNDSTCNPRTNLNGECGPHCRPSCITLQLNLNQFQQNYDDMILCPSKQETNDCLDSYSSRNKCIHTKRQPQPTCNTSLLYDQYPACYLEEAKCFGPSLYDDIVAVYERRWNTSVEGIPTMEHCTTLPKANPLHERFHDWPIVTPMNVHCDDYANVTSCFNTRNNNMIYFEYCNIIEEDYDSCHACSASDKNQENGKCNDDCSKIIQPFPSGWTTFVVSASIPYNYTNNSNSPDHNDASTSCRQNIPYANETGVACFAQRIEIYYPEHCPHCHDCPYNVGLGDMFGPLEVIGFGHAWSDEQQQPPPQVCAPCNIASKVRTSANISLSCSQIQQCHKSVDCSRGTALGIPSYINNQCSFQSIEEDDIVEEDSFDDDGNILEDDLVANPETDDIVPTRSPTTKKPVKKTTDAPTNAPVKPSPSIAPVVVSTNPSGTTNNTVSTPTIANDPSASTSVDLSSKEFRFSPIIATFIAIGLIVVISIQLILYKQRAIATVQQQQQGNRNTEEILYIEEPLEFDGIDKILSKKDNNSDDNDSQVTATDNEDNISQDPGNQRDEKGRWGNFVGAQRRSVTSISISTPPPQQQLHPEIRRFQTASIVERSDQNEVEALYMTGQHHVQQLPQSPSAL